MIALLLAALLATPAQEWAAEPPTFPSGSWARFCWDYRPAGCGGGQPEGARVLVARLGEPWMVWDEVRYPRRCWVGDMERLPWGLVFIVVVAFNSYGESPTEHGDRPGDGWRPAVCP